MIHYIIKNTRYKYILAVVAFLIVFLTLIKMEGMKGTDTVRVIFGGILLDRPIKQFAFIVNMSLVQFINADTVLLLIKRNEYFMFRCKKRSSLLVGLLIDIIISDFIFVILAFASFVVVTRMLQGTLSELPYGMLMGIFGRGWLTCILISVLQIISLIKLDEMYSFLVMLGLSVLGFFMSYLNLGAFSPFPVEFMGWKRLENILICIIYIVGTMIIAYVLYQKKDVSANDY